MNEIQSMDVSQDRPQVGVGPPRLSDSLTIPDDQLSKAIYSCLNRYEAMACAGGMNLELHTDFHHFADVVAMLNKGPVTPQFDVNVSEIGPANGFWLKGTNTRGEVVQVQAVRMDELTGESLANHCRSLRVFYRNPTESAHPQESCDVGAPASEFISGTVCYQGEFWLKGGDNGFRGREFATILPRICMAIALARWSPDFMYGTVAPVLVEKGVAVRYGYRNAQPHGIVWKASQHGENLDEWIMWMSWRELVDLIERS